MASSSNILRETDKLPGLIYELALYPQEKWVEQTIGRSEDVAGHNEILYKIYREIDELRWLRETTSYLFCRTERYREIQRNRGGTLTEFAYIPIPGLNNGKRIKHPCELEPRGNPHSILSQAPEIRSRELAWKIPYKTSTGDKSLIMIFTYDPLVEIRVRTISQEWEKCLKYWKHCVEEQGILAPGEKASYLHAFTGLHEWMNIIDTADGDKTPMAWKRHYINPTEAAHGANRGLDIYYSNTVVAYAWSTLEKQRGRERARALLQQDICKRVILYDPIYGKVQGIKTEKKEEAINFLLPGDTEREKIAKSFWDNTIGTAYTTGASDIHIEPIQVVGRAGCDLIVSLRKDAQLNFHTRVPSDLAADYTRFALETSGILKEELKRPQDGRRSWIDPVSKDAIDLRISVTPVGAPIQKIVMRLLDTNKLKRGITDIGLEPDEVRLWEKALALNQSLVLVSGPTNSGKSLRGTTPIRTDKGIISLKEIVTRHETGERFMTWNEKGWEPITNVHYCGTKEIVDIITNSGTKIEAAGTHPFLVLQSDLSMDWVKTANLSPSNSLVFHGRMCNNSIGDWNKYWLLGAWIGDGHLLTKKGKAIGFGFTAGRNCDKICPEYLDRIQTEATKQWTSCFWKKTKKHYRLNKGYKRGIQTLVSECVVEEEKGYRKRLPKSLWLATPYEIAGFFSGWIDTDGHCKDHNIEIVTKEEQMARDAKTILASIGIRAHLAMRKSNKKAYWRLSIRGCRNLQRLAALGVSPATTYKRKELLKSIEKIRRNDKVSFPIKNLGKLQKNIRASIQETYGPQSRNTYKKYLNLGPATRKTVGLNTLRKIFQLFPKALSLLPDIQRILENELEPEIIQSITKTGKYEEMYDIEVGKNHTYQVEGLICHNSTTLYAALLSIYQRDTRRSFATIEDPVEYRLPFRATQSPVNEEKGASYERLIRQAMRNDGDTFLIGEIRDTPTANAALQLSLTGHQVLSSIHANSAPETALRLLELGVDRYILSETLKLVVAQRLVPTACPHCKQNVNDNEIASLLRRYGGEILLESYGPLWEKKYKKKAGWIKSEGCPLCQFTGLSGMTAAQEFMVIDHKNRKFLKEGNIEKLEEAMKEKSHLRMEEIVWKFAWQGRIPIDQAGELTNQLKSG